MSNNLDDIDPSDMVDIDAQLYREELAKAKSVDPVGYVSNYGNSGNIIFACGGHTHRVSRQDAQRLARSIYDVIEGGDQP